MAGTTGFILGFDPGGKGSGRGNFGWSICEVAGGVLIPPANVGLASNAWDAFCDVKAQLSDNSRVLAAGIDAPLFWSKTGSRKIDSAIRKELADSNFPTPGGTVQQINSLWGACLVQGLLLCNNLREEWEGLPITETHPKALNHLLKFPAQSDICATATDLVDGLTNDHQRDATISAVAAWAMIRECQGWRDLYVDEPNPVQPFGLAVSYWMPIP